MQTASAVAMLPVFDPAVHKLPFATSKISVDQLLERLKQQNEIESQKALLGQHRNLFSRSLAQALKQQAEQFMRVDLSRSLQYADLLEWMTTLTHEPYYCALGILARANTICIGQGRYQEALELCSEAERQFRQLGCTVEVARCQVSKVWPYAQIGEYAKSIEIGTTAATVLEQHEQWMPLVWLLINLASVYGQLGNDAEALSYLLRARHFAESLANNSDTTLAAIDHNMAVLLRNLGQFEESLIAVERAIESHQRAGRLIAAAQSQNNKAVTFHTLGRYNEALALLDRVRQTLLAGDCRLDAIQVDLFICDCLLELRRFDDVLEHCQNARLVYGGMGAQFSSGEAILKEAIAFTGLRKFGHALSALAEAEKIFERQQNEVWLASVQYERGVVFYQQANFAQCLELALSSAAVFTTHHYPAKHAQSCLLAARAAIVIGQRQEAIDLLTQALRICDESHLLPIIFQARHLLGKLAELEQQPEVASVHYELAIRALESLRGRLMVEYQADYLGDKQLVFEDAVNLAIHLEQPLRALEYAERAKSRALFDVMKHGLDLSVRAATAQDGEMINELSNLQSERNRLVQRAEATFSLQDSTVRGQSPSTIDQNSITSLEKRITDTWHRLQVRNAEYTSRELDSDVDVKSIQSQLSERCVLVEYYVVDNHFVVFVVTARNVWTERLRLDVSRAQQQLRLLLLNMRSITHRCTESRIVNLISNANGILFQFYQQLIAPIREKIEPYEQIIFVPHSALHYLPFYALHDGSKYLIEQFEISHLPAAGFLYLLHQQKPASEESFIFGNSYHGRLSHAVDEARTVAQTLSGVLFLNGEATGQNLRNLPVSIRLLHLATHAEFRADNPLFSGLALEDGLLTTLDIFNMELNASLVTLSACQTGQVVVGGGDELLGLMRAFLYAGASSLLLGLWSVEDRSTAQLMESFYTNLTQGMSKGKALRQAQLDMIQGNATGAPALYKHPYFWAPFFLIGDIGDL